MSCTHNQRTRYTYGFYCEDCDNFFGLDTPDYRYDEYIWSLDFVVNNMIVDLKRANKKIPSDMCYIFDRLEHATEGSIADEKLVVDAEALIKKYRGTPNDASMVIK